VVAEPGVYTLAAGARLIDLVVAAGGLLPGADHAALNLAARLTDGQRVIVPTVRPTLLPSPGTPSKERDPSQTRDSTPGAAVTEAKQLNLNTASEAELDSLPRIGPAMAAAIVEWRAANGGFRSVEDLLRVRGIGAATLEALRPYVTAP
jgi:competence protein ComEA